MQARKVQRQQAASKDKQAQQPAQQYKADDPDQGSVQGEAVHLVVKQDVGVVNGQLDALNNMNWKQYQYKIWNWAKSRDK